MVLLHVSGRRTTASDRGASAVRGVGSAIARLSRVQVEVWQTHDAGDRTAPGPQPLARTWGDTRGVKHAGVLSPLIVQVSNAFSAGAQQVLKMRHTFPNILSIRADLSCTALGRRINYLNDGPAVLKGTLRVRNASGPNARVLSWMYLDVPQFSVQTRHPLSTFKTPAELVRFKYPTLKLERRLDQPLAPVRHEMDFLTSIRASVGGGAPVELGVVRWDVDQTFRAISFREAFAGSFAFEAHAGSSAPLALLTTIPDSVDTTFAQSLLCPAFTASSFYDSEKRTWTFGGLLWVVTRK